MSNCITHPRTVPGFESIDQVISMVCLFNKTLTIELISELSNDYARQSFADNEGGRPNLAAFLRETSQYLLYAADDLRYSDYFSQYNYALPSSVSSIKQLAFDIGNLQYDVSVEFFSKYLFLLPPASKNIYLAKNSLQEAWNISEPKMRLN